MALPSRYGIDKNMNSMAGLSAYENGGKGSGNFGHSGRPGKIGGSGSGNSSDILSPRPKKSEETSGQTEEAKKVEFAQLMARSEKLRRQIALTQEAINETDDEIFADELGGDVGQGTSWLMSRSMEYEDELKSLKSELIDVRKRLKKIADDLSSEQKNGLVLNGGKGSGNFGHAGRPGERGGSSASGSGGSSKKIRVHEGSQEMDYFYAEDGDRVLASGKTKEEALAKAIATQKKFQDQAKIVQEDIEDRIGQKVKKGEEYTALDEASKSRFKEFHGEDGTEYTYDKGNGMITKTNPETGDQEVVTKKKDGGGEYAKRKDYKAEQKGVEVRDGHSIGTEFADLEAQLSTARTNLKTMKKDSGKAYDDLAGRNRYLTRQSEIARAFSQARALGKSKLSTETKKLVREMETELRSIMADYTDLGTKKYFDPDLNVER